MWVRVRAALGLVAGFAAMAGAQERVGPEFQANSHTTGDQRNPAVSADPDGNFVLVWQSINQDGHDFSVVGRRFDRLGTPRGSEFVVNVYTTSSQAEPAVSVDGSGRFVVAWDSLQQDGGSRGIFARRFDANGTALGLSEFRVNSYTTGSQNRPDVAHTASGGFVVVWEGPGQDGSSYAILGRRFDVSGGALGAEFLVNAYTTDVQGHPAVDTFPDGGFVVVWNSSGQDGSGQGVFARLFDASGAS